MAIIEACHTSLVRLNMSNT